MFNFEKYSEIDKIIKKKGIKTQIIAISKNHTLQKVEYAISKNINIFGENRVQEAIQKYENIKKTNNSIELHLTGPLQTNKVKHALNIFDVFHTVDREKLLKELSKFPDKIIKKSFFVQVNIGKEKTKSGIFPEDTKDFLFFLRQEMKLPIIGLMCIPPIDDDPSYHFNKLKLLANENKIDELSIGMSDDYEKALQFNPTYIRLGTILFGKRS